MPRLFRFFVFLLITGLVFTTQTSAHETKDNGLRLIHPFATPTPPGAPNGAAYVDISTDDDPVSLVAASSPVSKVVEIHDMTMKDGVMRMRRLDSLEVAAGETLKMRPGGGEHLMLIGLEQPLKVGDRFPITLEFADRDSVTLEVWVQEADEGSQTADQHEH
ncbi:copper chaperone PCu(A)C [Halomonas sp. GXIMD04776]|uniref:copper chaperone PCu(A)C n=1 Tax=Halomonas sp. GXIMD04776 TaxID=3415605 RepID=UPI003CBBC91E